MSVNEDLTEKQLEEFKNAFDEVDNLKEGVISSHMLSEIMKHLGLHPTELEVKEMIQKADKNGNDVIEFDEFAAIMKTYLQNQTSSNVTKDIFQLFDKNKNGVISTKELRHMMKSIGEKLTQKQISQMMAFADLNKDGSIDFEEFSKLMEEVPSVKRDLERVASNA